MDHDRSDLLKRPLGLKTHTRSTCAAQSQHQEHSVKQAVLVLPEECSEVTPTPQWAVFSPQAREGQEGTCPGGIQHSPRLSLPLQWVCGSRGQTWFSLQGCKHAALEKQMAGNSIFHSGLENEVLLVQGNDKKPSQSAYNILASKQVLDYSTVC